MKQVEICNVHSFLYSQIVLSFPKTSNLYIFTATLNQLGHSIHFISYIYIDQRNFFLEYFSTNVNPSFEIGS